MTRTIQLAVACALSTGLFGSACKPRRPRAPDTALFPNDEIPLAVLRRAGLPPSAPVRGHHGIRLYTVDVARVSWQLGFRTQRGNLTVAGHPVRRKRADDQLRVRGAHRLVMEGAPILRGCGPISVWQGRRLVEVLWNQEPFILADIGGRSSPYLFMWYDNLGAGGPIELHMSECSPERGGCPYPGLGFQWLDTEARGDTYVLRPAHRGKHPPIEVLRLAEGRWRRVGTLVVDTDAHRYELKEDE